MSRCVFQPRDTRDLLHESAVSSSYTSGVERQEQGHVTFHIASDPSRLNPAPDDYNITPFVDKCVFTVQAGSGGHGCVSFLREKYIPDGPPNGGDGGTGGHIFIQAVRSCTSLNKLVKKREYAAGRGQHGQGGAKGGKKGEDILLEVPVGTVIREIKRWDPVQIQMDVEKQNKISKGTQEDLVEKLIDRFLFYPGLKASQRPGLDSLPRLPLARRSSMAALAPQSPIRLDLDEHMDKPMLLAAGAIGGYGNPHFAGRDTPKPKVATKGDTGMRIGMALELKLVADVGLVGLPNAGKSTLLRAMSNSRARVGNWAFTTLQPNIGTVVLDNYKGRPWYSGRLSIKDLSGNGEPRTRFTIADIPGIIEDAHLNKGLGLDFLRHIERAQTLAFVIDLSAGDAVEQLNGLWREVGEYQTMKERESMEYSQRIIQWNPLEEADTDPFLDGISYKEAEQLPPLLLPPITRKPWFVVATKADLPETQDNFLKLRDYVTRLEKGEFDHPSGRPKARREGACVVPISGIKGEGVDRIVEVVVNMLDQ
ncbi:GTP-binding protein Obg/CgtA [Microthyrium microscopicum]|uniref:GTP-binding protein Obg/CgtA n=1 Tax=Microthyrium microscopicum TaxID=703497 RepID=A0A6A6UVC1_9PEZI|nr:GTP-binding protein Obg/CgtA [Microthyrium microscopicum]